MDEEPKTIAPGPAENPAVEKNPDAKQSVWKRPPVIFIGSALLGVILYFGVAEVVVSFTHETTDNAFIESDLVAVAPRIAGQVTAVHVIDNQSVRSNDLLVEIDAANFAIAVSQKRAAASSQ